MKRRRPQVPCIVHGFRQKTAVMDGLLRQGALFSFGPAGLRQAKAYGYPLRIPASQLLLETDTLPLDQIEEAFRLAAEAWEVEAEALAFMAQNRFRELFGHWEGD
jgi:Tat protein secretion system quality control protein TatD with DNase activity